MSKDLANIIYGDFLIENDKPNINDVVYNKDDLIRLYFEKLDIANKTTLTRFCFEYQNAIYLVEWNEPKWSDPILLDKI